MRVLATLRVQDPGVPVMMLTAHGSERVAVSAMKAGAFDYIPKPFDPDELVLAVKRAAENRKPASRERAAPDRGLDRPSHRRREPGGTARARRRHARRAEGRHRAAHRRERCRQGRPRGHLACALQAREQAAHSLQRGGHPRGARRGELFGHMKGAFTGAHAARLGYFQQADKGTLFIDEIASCRS